MKKLFMILMLTAALAACHSYDDHDPMQIDRPVIDRTVIIYMAAENDLSVHGWNNLNDIREGSKKLSANQCLLVYVDRSHETELPWLGRFQGGQLTDSVSISDMGISQHDEYASDSRVFEDVLRYAVNHFHASQDYGLVLWGHSTGWLLEDSIPRTRGYGFDNGHNDRTTPTGYYLNIPTMNQILKRIPAHWSYIFADCCLFACLESAYEMRNTVDYIVGSVAEIPGQGAPYSKIIPDMFLPAEMACKAIADKYYANCSEAQPFAVIKNCEMDQLASATRTALQVISDNIDDAYPDMNGIIHYLYTDFHIMWGYRPEYSMFYDAGDFIKHHTPQEVYASWRQAYDRAVIHKLMATRWRTAIPWGGFYDNFKITEESYHGVSMFVPQDPRRGRYAKLNEDIKRLTWWNAVYEGSKWDE